ncbi:phosphoribosyl-AMP cyclohydrolase [Escherichia coli]
MSRTADRFRRRGHYEHFLEAFRDANVDGALAASVFHKQIINIGELKRTWPTRAWRSGYVNRATTGTAGLGKTDGLLPVVVQHAVSGEVLMLGYMNQRRWRKRSTAASDLLLAHEHRLWTKGETFGHFLNVVSITPDCDNELCWFWLTPSVRPAIKVPTAASERQAPVVLPVSTGAVTG